MKKVEKIVVIHLGEGIDDSLRKSLWKRFGSDIMIKPVHYVALLDEFEFKKRADLVICKPSVSGHAKLILSAWPYEVQIVCLGKPEGEEGDIDYAPTLEEWDHKKYFSP